MHLYAQDNNKYKTILLQNIIEVKGNHKRIVHECTDGFKKNQCKSQYWSQYVNETKVTFNCNFSQIVQIKCGHIQSWHMQP